MKKRILNIFIALLFCAAIFPAPLLFFLLPKEELSQREKRYLAPAPELSVQTLTDGSFAKKLSAYIADHFPGREFLVGVNAYHDYLAGRQSTKDYLLARGGRLFAKPVQPDQKVLDGNLEAVNDFAGKIKSTGAEIPVTLMLVPSSGSVMLKGQDYPDEQVINYAYSKANTGHVDLMAAFRNSGNVTDLYYRTDHHWTSEGAFAAACAYRRSLGRGAMTWTDYTRQSCGPFYGSAYSGSGLWLTKADSLELWHSGKLMQVSNETGSLSDSVFYPQRLEEEDKYTVYLDGNHALVRIENLSGGVDGGGNLLVIRDSFSNSLGCFLADLYDKVILVDLRYYKLPMTDLMMDEDIDEVLIEYSVQNFTEDTNLAFLSLDPEPLRLREEERRRPPNYFAPPPELTDEFFDGAYYLGDSVNGTLASYCLANGKMRNTLIATNALLSYGEVVERLTGHLIYNGRFVTLPEVLEERQPSMLIAALGCNDLARNELDHCEENVLKFLDMVRACDPDMQIFIQSVMPIRVNMTTFNQQEVEEFNLWLKDNAERLGYCYMELDKPFKDSYGNLSATYRYNDTHINLAGGSVWYKELMKTENYYNLPESFYVEYDGETNLPLSQGPREEREPEPEPEPEPTRPETVLDTVYSQICEELNCPQMLELDGRTIESYLGLEPGSYTDGRFYLCANNLKADEIWLAEAESEEAAAAILEAARNRIELKASSYEAYLPEESEIARRGIAVSRGRFVALLISPDAERMQEIFLAAVG